MVASYSLLAAIVFANFNAISSFQDGNNIAAPFFNTGDNLSFDDCGKWNESVSRKPPWRVWIWSGGEYACAGVLVSHNTIISTEAGDCWRAVRSFQRNHLHFYAYLGGCFDNYSTSRCAQNTINRGFVAKLLQVSEIKLTERLDAYLWTMEKIPILKDFYSPICLFNRGNALDVEQSDSYYYSSDLIDSVFTEGNIAPLDKCMENETKIKLESSKPGPFNWLLCISMMQDSHYAHVKILVNYYKGRYFLRGYLLEEDVIMNPFDEAKYMLFVDLLPFYRSLILNTTSLAILPEIHPPKPQKEFAGEENLSFPNCGQKMRVPVRSRREVEESSEDDGPPIGLIVRGHAALRDNHPWHAEIRAKVNKEPDSNHGFCGGTLISKRAVLTAAHCLFQPDQVAANTLIVTIGMYDVRQRNEPGIQTKTPRSLKIHQNYSHSAVNFENDIALLIFASDFELSAKVHPICLWNRDFNLDNIVDEPAVLVGWGLDENYTQPNILQTVNLPIRSHPDCFLQRRSFFGKYLKPGKNFCAGYTNGTSACNGDSGGGLVVEKNGRWFIRGLISFSRSKKVIRGQYIEFVCHSDYYSLFTDLGEYMDWIVTNTPDIS